MGKPPSKEIRDFMEKHSIDSDEIWEVHGNSWCIKHKALERAGAAAGIVWDRPAMIETDSAAGVVSICVFGKLGDRVEWSIGEAAPKNNKNAYPYAMAEKRGKDRCILKLLNTHGYLYSEAEFEADEKPATLPKKDAKEIYTKLQRESREAAISREAFKLWLAGNVDRIKILPEDWQDTFRLQCEELMADLRNKEAA
jgi:hypothetical protein